MTCRSWRSIEWLTVAVFLMIAPVVAETTTGTVIDYFRYGRVLAHHVDGSGLVDYRNLKQSPEDLNAFLQTLADVNPEDYAGWISCQKIAFWLNAYNAITLHAIVNHYPIQASGFSSWIYPDNSIRQIEGVWEKLRSDVMGKAVTLEEIEHEILRRDFDEPRIHIALVCAAHGCPILRREPYVGPRLDEQLRDQSERFLKRKDALHFDEDRGILHLSPIFKWFGKDFVSNYGGAGSGGYERSDAAVLGFVGRHVPVSKRKLLESRKWKIRYTDYDWSLNEQEGPAPARGGEE
ncbi:DUF547 domain-containing protein [bacterium]|nr:DUF547 domain-containing protein [bacterium]